MMLSGNITFTASEKWSATRKGILCSTIKFAKTVSVNASLYSKEKVDPSNRLDTVGC